MPIIPVYLSLSLRPNAWVYLIFDRQVNSLGEIYGTHVASPDQFSFTAGDSAAFEKLFRRYYTELCSYSLRYVKQAEIAEEIVQDTFVALWQKEQVVEVHTSVKAYLYKAVQNRSLNYLKSQFGKQKFESDQSHQHLMTNNTREALDYHELESLVNEAITQLPQQCRTIFEMSRIAGLSYQQIADELNLSPKTVENQMGIALKKLREYLRNYWDLLSIFLIVLSEIA